MGLIEITLVIIALYCFGMWIYLAQRAARFGENWSSDTYHLGLCGILAAGFLGLLLK